MTRGCFKRAPMNRIVRVSTAGQLGTSPIAPISNQGLPSGRRSTKGLLATASGRITEARGDGPVVHRLQNATQPEQPSARQDGNRIHRQIHKTNTNEAGAFLVQFGRGGQSVKAAEGYFSFLRNLSCHSTAEQRWGSLHLQRSRPRA